MIIARKLTSGEPMDQAYAAHVVDDVLIPVLTNRAVGHDRLDSPEA